MMMPTPSRHVHGPGPDSELQHTYTTSRAPLKPRHWQAKASPEARTVTPNGLGTQDGTWRQFCRDKRSMAPALSEGRRSGPVTVSPFSLGQ